jgi:predicted TPR repeat methyltransferase
MTSTTSEAFFDAKYRAEADPWSFATNDYELNRYDRILNALDGRRFELAYEPGCSVGVLTVLLAPVCDRVEACDISIAAVEKAQGRCRDLMNVSIHHARLSSFIPLHADLYVFSEVGYYLSRGELVDLLGKHIDALQDGATLIACHWRGSSPDHLLSGDEVHEVIHGVPGLFHKYSEQHTEFRLDRWVKGAVEQ